MFCKLFMAVLFFAASSHVYGQEPNVKNLNSEKSSSPQAISREAEPVVADKNPPQPVSVLIGQDIYTRPNAKKRIKNFAKSIVGPVALFEYITTAGMLTARNSPKEWGGKWNGFGNRFGNVVGKGLIRNSTIYGLDEALKLDSNFYLSEDRSVSARLRNSVLSSLTARNKNGKRVVGIPRITGSFAAEVISSEAWYPRRYNYVHGLKGGFISLGVNVGFNLFKEFIWKK